MIKLLWRTDVHIADKAPGGRSDDWLATVLDKLEQVGQIAKAHSVDAVLDGGDFTHIKQPSRNSHKLIQQVCKIHAEYPCPIYANVGNHDCVYGDYNYLDQQPLGVLFESGVFQRCYDHHEILISGPPSVRIVGVPYHGNRYDWNRFTRFHKGEEDYLVMMVHCLASDQGGSMFEGEDIIKYSDLNSLAPDVFCFGHWHKDQGVVQLDSGKWVVNIGSLTRGSLSQDNFSRIPSVALMEFGGEIRIEKIPLKIKPPEEVFKVQEYERKQIKSSLIEEFVDSLPSHIQRSGQSLKDSISSLNVEAKIRERALSYLEKAE